MASELPIYFLYGFSVSALVFNMMCTALFRMRSPFFLSAIPIYFLMVLFIYEQPVKTPLLIIPSLFYFVFSVLLSKKNHNLHSQFYLNRTLGYFCLVVTVLGSALHWLDFSEVSRCLLSLFIFCYHWSLVHYIKKFRQNSAYNFYGWVVIIFILILSSAVTTHYFIFLKPIDILYIISSIISIAGLLAVVYFYLRSYYDQEEQNEIKRSLAYRKKLSLINSNKVLAERLLVTENLVINNQIKPHFLFNAINSISSLIISDEYDKSSYYLNELDVFLNEIFSSKLAPFQLLSRDLITLSTYVNLENLRTSFNTNLTVHNNAEISLNRINIPHLFLQPLVENSIWHGYDNVDEAHLQIHISNNKDTLFLKVIDDGKGINKEKAPDLKGHKSAGLKIIQNRLNTISEHYRTPCSFKIKNKLDDSHKVIGTEVTISLPLIKTEV